MNNTPPTKSILLLIKAILGSKGSLLLPVARLEAANKDSARTQPHLTPLISKLGWGEGVGIKRARAQSIPAI